LWSSLGIYLFPPKQFVNFNFSISGYKRFKHLTVTPVMGFGGLFVTLQSEVILISLQLLRLLF